MITENKLREIIYTYPKPKREQLNEDIFKIFYALLKNDLIKHYSINISEFSKKLRVKADNPHNESKEHVKLKVITSRYLIKNGYITIFEDYNHYDVFGVKHNMDELSDSYVVVECGKTYPEKILKALKTVYPNIPNIKPFRFLVGVLPYNSSFIHFFEGTDKYYHGDDIPIGNYCSISFFYKGNLDFMIDKIMNWGYDHLKWKKYGKKSWNLYCNSEIFIYYQYNYK